MALTVMQRSFAREYWASGNGTQAAIKAGYSKKTAYSQAHRLLKNIEIQKEIKKHEEESRSLLQQQFARDALSAREIMFNIMKDDDAPEHVRLSAAKDFLDRAGYKPTDKQSIEHSGDMTVNNPFADLSTEELRKLADAHGDG